MVAERPVDAVDGDEERPGRRPASRSETLGALATEPKADVPRLFSPDDYPQEALTKHQWGTVVALVWVETDGWSVGIIDQTKLPHEFALLRLASAEDWTQRQEAAEALCDVRDPATANRRASSR